MGIKKPAGGKNSIDQFGSPEDFLKSCDFLFGKQAWEGATISEGGFKPGSVASLSLLDIAEKTDKKGTKYYQFEILSRTPTVMREDATSLSLPVSRTATS